MPCQLGNNGFFDTNNYIKFLNSDIVAIEGPNTIERLIGGDIRIPYKQVLKGRVILKEGQLNYLMNHLGLGDNATFLAIFARYDAKSVNEEDNYLEYYYSDDTGKMRYMDQVLILTGNSTHRIPQLYFNNPNTSYKVVLDVMVAVIDETYTFFQDTTNQSGLSFYNLQCNTTKNCIETFIVNESILVYDTATPRNPLVYFVLNEISSISISDKIVVVDEQTTGKVYLEFINVEDAKQAYSLINYVLNNSGVVIQDLNPIVDSQTPVVTFNTRLGDLPSAPYVTYQGMTAGPYNTGITASLIFTFSTSAAISLMTYGTASGTTLNKPQLKYLFVDSVVDNRDGIINLTDTDITLYDYNSVVIESIVEAGTYSMGFDLTDLAGNKINSATKITLSITD